MENLTPGLAGNTIMYARNLPANVLKTTTQQWAQVNSLGIQPRPDKKAVRVLVAGDHASLRSSLRTILEMDPRIMVVGEASDDCEIIKMSNRLRPDVVLMDLDMRCCDDFEAVAEISKRKLAGSVVALTIHDDPAERTAAKRAGVSLFLEKGISSKELIDTLRGLTTGDPPPK